ncbi:hypothetical protein ACFQNE_14235 [Gordonia phosphorivorans]|uniref:ParD-like antitoxin of type II toxin-antitoxin system n=1 Tax=Gordonia phosphorivorans TaxID=1056982 RepID=A0ABV6H801_9ACTN
MTTAGRMTRVSPDLYADAERVVDSTHRSIRQQLEHWTRVGRNMDTFAGRGLRRVHAALEGRLPSEQLTADESALFDAEVDARIEELLPVTDMSATTAGPMMQGLATQTADGQESLVYSLPDGRTVTVTVTGQAR